MHSLLKESNIESKEWYSPSHFSQAFPLKRSLDSENNFEDTEKNLKNFIMNESLCSSNLNTLKTEADYLPCEKDSLESSYENFKNQRNSKISKPDEKGLPGSNKSEEMQKMRGIIETLNQRCKNYEKQNESLRKEIFLAGKEITQKTKENQSQVIQNLNEKLSFHENMLEKVCKTVEKLCDDQHCKERVDFNEKNDEKASFVYQKLFFELEFLGKTMQNYKNQIMENDAKSQIEIGPAKCLPNSENPILKVNMSGNNTPDCMNPARSQYNLGSKECFNQTSFIHKNAKSCSAKKKNKHSSSVTPLMPTHKKSTSRLSTTKEVNKTSKKKLSKKRSNEKKVCAIKRNIII